VSEGSEIRCIAEGETIPVGVVHDFLLAVLHSDAIYDVLLERMAFFDDDVDVLGRARARSEPKLHRGPALDQEDWPVVGLDGFEGTGKETIESQRRARSIARP
jgi:hypothetical protein